MDRRREVLAALRRADGTAVSGEELAGALGVSRAAIGKHVAALRETGYEIAAVPGEGYQLVAVPEAPVALEVASLVRDPLWVDIRGGGPTESTNDDAKALARAGAPEGTVVLADRQETGRGRLGRTWESPVGGAYMSAVLRPDVSVPEAPPIALVTALGVGWGLESLGAAVALKWPNDVLLDGGKLAGILLEMSAEADRVDWVVIGCGINVRRPADAATLDVRRPAAAPDSADAAPRGLPAAYLEDALPDASPAIVAAAALDGIARAYGAFLSGGFPAVRDDFVARHALTGRPVTVSDREGRALADGTVSGVDGWGRLEVETADGPVALAAGEVTLR